MARGPNEKQLKAEELFRQGMKLVDIAKVLNVPDGTVRRWKSTYKWDGEQSERSVKRANSKSERSVKKIERKQVVDKPHIEKLLPEVEEALDENGMTERQRLFCLYMTKYHVGSRAYKKVYGCDDLTAKTNASRLLAKANIKAYYNMLNATKVNREYLSEEDIFEKYMDIAFSDITDYITFGKKFVEARDGSEIEVSYVDLKESTQIDGTLISEVTQGRDGIKIKLVDKQQALKWLSDHMDLATEEQRLKMAVMKKNAQGEDEEEIADDGFMDALNSSAAADWNDEE